MRGVQLYGLTCPLLTKGDGAKMGKTEQGTVWLAAERTSPYQFYQYWINVEDADVGNCLRMLTTLSRDEIESLDSAREQDAARRDSQRRLAEELTRLVHGAEGLTTAQRATNIFFGEEISDLTDAQLGEIFAEVPSQRLSRRALHEEGGLPIVDALVAAGLAKSKGEARRTVEQGGAYVNNRRIDQIDARLALADLASETTMVLRSGKKKYALLRFDEG
jgi:tyrosyl-tRNA synthetase